jgi:hypothetical protein
MLNLVLLPLRQKHSQKGSAFTFIFIAVALLGALSAYLASSVSQSNTSTQLFRVQSELESQMQAIRADLMSCVLVYDSGAGNENPSGNRVYPHSPSTDTSLIAAFDAGLYASNSIEAVECPNKTGLSPPERQLIWHPVNGKFPPAAISGFGTNRWTYINDDDGSTPGTGVRFVITGPVDGAVITAMQNIQARYSANEVDVDPATATLTFWIIRN